jgi:hypothetical protein
VFDRAQPKPYRDAPVVFWFDLDLEVGSWMHEKQCERYVKELWSDYVDDYGAADPLRAPPDTYGFTFTDARWNDEAGNARLKLLFEAYDAKGVRPNAIAFDLYKFSSSPDGPWAWLKDLAQSLDHAHVADGVPLFVEETSYNSRVMAGMFRRARAPETVGGLGLNIRHVVQWPKEMNTGSLRAFSVATTERYDNFLKGPAFDFDGDGRADRAIWRPSQRRFYLESSLKPENVLRSRVFAEGAKPAPGDYDGDGLWDFAVWRRLGLDTRFEIEFSDGSEDRIVDFHGLAAIHAVLGDFDGDGRHDPAVYDAKAARGGHWSIARSRDGRQDVRFGGASDIPVPFDWRGDRIAGIAAFRAATMEILRSGATTFQFGLPNDDPVVSDYDGDGIEDFAVRRSGNDTWYIRQSSNLQVVATRFGCASDIPVPADYDGDLKTDLAIFRPRMACGDDIAMRSWQYQSSATLETVTLPPFGLAGDIPVQAAYLACGQSECGYAR